MSARCSFTSEYINCDDDYETLWEKFRERHDKTLCVSPPAQWGDNIMPIIQGKISDWNTDDVFTELWDILSDTKTKDSVRFVILADCPDKSEFKEWPQIYILDKDPDGWVDITYITGEDIEKINDDTTKKKTLK